VAIGAAIQAGVLQGDGSRTCCARSDPDVAGHRDAGRRVHPIIDRNTTIPTKKSQVFSTAEDSQDTRSHPVSGRAVKWRPTTR